MARQRKIKSETFTKAELTEIALRALLQEPLTEKQRNAARIAGITLYDEPWQTSPWIRHRLVVGATTTTLGRTRSLVIGCQMQKGTTMETEKRVMPLQIRAKAGRISGYAAVFDSDSADIGFVERIRPGVFKNALKRSTDVIATFNHDINQIFGRRGVNLDLHEDRKGLFMTVSPVATDNYTNARENIEAGLVTKQSFSFTVAKDEWVDTDSDTPKRTIVEVGELFDVGPVVSPAYNDTSIALRSLAAAKKGKNKMEYDKDDRAKQPRQEVQRPSPGPISVTTDEADKRQFETFGEFGQHVVRAGTPGGQMSRQLVNLQKRATGLGEGVPSEGGFLVEQQFSKEIMKSMFSGNPLLSKVKTYNIRSNSIKIPAIDESSRADGSRHGGVRAYWIAEAGEKTASAPKFRQMELNLNKCVVLVYATDELLEDAGALDSYLRETAGDEIGFAVQNGIINGSGAGQPLGILNAGCVVSVSKEAGQTADTVVFENILKMYQRMPARNRANAVWVCNQDVEQQLFQMSLGVGTSGQPVFLPGGGASEAPFATLMGRPLLPIEQCPTLGDAGDILFADFSQYVMATRGGIKSDVSIHVRFVYDESVFRFVHRIDGQPALAEPVTPFAGLSTLSPFVAIEART